MTLVQELEKQVMQTGQRQVRECTEQVIRVSSRVPEGSELRVCVAGNTGGHPGTAPAGNTGFQDRFDSNAFNLHETGQWKCL